MSNAPDGYDPDTLEYVGPCPGCGTDHDWWDGPETVGGALACARARDARAESENAPT